MSEKADVPSKEFDVVSDDMAVMLAAKTGAERLGIASRMFTSARRMLIHHLSAEHPDWETERVEAEAARRLSHGAV